MTPQRLDRVLTAWRIGDLDGAYAIIDATGSMLYPGRWNGARSPMIYASEPYSTAMLEKLAHGSGRLPANQHFIEITIPNGVSYEVVARRTCRAGTTPPAPCRAPGGSDGSRSGARPDQPGSSRGHRDRAWAARAGLVGPAPVRLSAASDRSGPEADCPRHRDAC